MIVTILAISILGFIVLHFYTDYSNWANTGNTFAEGMTNGGQNNYEYVQKRYCATYDGYTRHNVPVSASQSKEKGCQMKCDEEGENCNTIAVGDGTYGGGAYNCTTYKNCALSAPGTSSHWTRGSGTTGGNYEYYKKNATQNQYDEEIRKAYREILGREPDPGGFNNWKNAMANGMTVEQLRTAFINSDEAKNHREEEVKKAYREILGREPDPGGLNHYKTLLQNGTTVAQMRAYLENSDEAKNRRNNSSECERNDPSKVTGVKYNGGDFPWDGTKSQEWNVNNQKQICEQQLGKCFKNWNAEGKQGPWCYEKTGSTQQSTQYNNNSPNIECAANYGSTMPSDGSNSGPVGAKYVCPQERPVCKDYKFNVKWGNCESTTVNPTIGAAQPVQGAMQGGMEHQQQMPQQMPQQIPQQQPPMGQQMIQQMPQQQPVAQQQASIAQGSPVAVTSNFARPTDFTLFNEQILQQVLANKNLIPEDIPLNAEDQASLIRVGKSFMLDVAKIRNLVLPNIKQNDYEILGRIVSKHLKDKEDGATRAHLDITKSRIMNTVQALLSSTELNSSIIQNGTTPSVTTSNRTTGMMSDKTNAYMTGKGNYDFAKGMNGMSGKYTDSYKPTNDTINPKPYDSVWSVFY